MKLKGDRNMEIIKKDGEVILAPGCIDLAEVEGIIVCKNDVCEIRKDCLMAEVGKKPRHTLDIVPGQRKMEGGLRKSYDS